MDHEIEIRHRWLERLEACGRIQQIFNIFAVFWKNTKKSNNEKNDKNINHCHKALLPYRTSSS